MSAAIAQLILPAAAIQRFTLEAPLVGSAKALKGRQGRRGLPENIVAAMYQDYLKLHSLALVGRKYGRTRQSVYDLFHGRGLKLYAKNWGQRIVHGGRVFTPGKNGYFRATTGDREPLHHRLWLDAGNTIPKGWQVSFKDGDHTHLALENLFCDSLIGVTLHHQRRLGTRKFFTAEELRQARCRNAINSYRRRRREFLARGLTTTGKVRARKANFVTPNESPWTQAEQRVRQLANTRANVLANYHRRAERFAAQGLNTRGQRRTYRVKGKSDLFRAYDEFRAGINTAGASWDTTLQTVRGGWRMNPNITDLQRLEFLQKLLASDLLLTDWEQQFTGSFRASSRPALWFTEGRRTSTDKMWMKYGAELNHPFPTDAIATKIAPADKDCCQCYVRLDGRQQHCNAPAFWQAANGWLYCNEHAEAAQRDFKRMGKALHLSKFAVLAATMLLVASAGAMDRLAALSMIESADNDFVRGRAGEVSRFQIRREVWLRSTSLPISRATDPKAALAVAQALTWCRCNEFQLRLGRPATDLEFYILWNAPSQINDPSKVVLERARRFVNLVSQK